MPSDVTYTSEVPSAEDIALLAADLRPVEREDVLRTFSSVEDAIESCCEVSEYLRCIRMHGDLISVFGVVPDPESGVAVPWMLTSDLLSFAHPVRVVREAREQFKMILEKYPVLHNIVPVEDTEAISLLRSLGFEVDESRTIKSGSYDYYGFWYGRAG